LDPSNFKEPKCSSRSDTTDQVFNIFICCSNEFFEVSGTLYTISQKIDLIDLIESGFIANSFFAHSFFPKRNSPPWTLVVNVHFFSSIPVISIYIHACPCIGGVSLSEKGIYNLVPFTKPAFFLYCSSEKECHLSCFRSFKNFVCSVISLFFSEVSVTGTASSSSHSSFSL